MHHSFLLMIFFNFKNIKSPPINSTPNQISGPFPTPNIISLDKNDRVVINYLNVVISAEFILSLSPFGPSVNIEIKNYRQPPTPGFNFKYNKDNTRIILQHFSPYSPVHGITLWKSTLRYIIIITINDSIIENMDNITYAISIARLSFNT